MDDISLDRDQNGESNGGEQELISRPYQTQLEEVALSRNTIIHLPTGSGKTFIAVRVIKRLREDLKKPWNDGGKRTFFLVNTVPLVQQQKKVIERLCPVTVGGYSSEDGVDYWKKQKWDEELAKYQVIVMTSQILADMLTHSYIRIDNINLLIFDECHHAVIDHPMRLIMKQFETYPVEKHPRVLGLTATLLNSNVSVGKVADTLRLLETTFHATIATVDALGEVLSFSTNPIELVKYYEAPTLTSAALEAIEILEDLKELVLSVELPRVNVADIKLEFWQRDISVDSKKIVKEVKNMLVSMVNFIEELGVFGGSLGILAYIILLERLKRKAVTSEEEQLYKFTITRCTEARIILLSSMQKETGYEKIRKHSSPKILELLNVLKEYSPQYYNRPEVMLKVNQVKKPLCGIIFTQQRFTAKVLYNLLKEVKETNNEEFGFLKHDFIVGCNMNPLKCTREQFYVKKTCETALLKFTNKDLNLLISTSVIEEGIDIPQCSLILRYDPPQEYRSYIQSKGRARSKESRVVMLIQAENLQTFQRQYKSYQITENYIQEMLVGNTDFRDAPTQEEIQDELYEDDDIAPYISERGSRLSAVSAASLLNRYCSALPHDKFTPITPMWVQEDLMDEQKGKLRLVKIFMPIACPVKEAISGMPMMSLKNAKRSAALNACKKLHQVGELEEITMLPKHQLPIDFEMPDIKECFLCWPWDEVEDPDVPKAGTKKQMRRHEKVFPKHLKWTARSLPATFYLHIIKLEANFDPPTESREKALYDLLKRSEGYGFLTPQRLPTVCDFPMFLTIGEVSTSIEMNYAVIQLMEDSFELVKYFHFFLFDQVLQVAKNFVVYEGIENCMFFVPICKSGKQDYNIDWDVMQTYTIIPPVAEPASEERKNIKVKPEEYKDHVVTPWYRGNILPERYMVSNVLEYMTPLSPFDSTTPLYGTFANYYLNKYNLEVLGDKDQPLLEVLRISSRMNCLLPRAATIKSFTDKQRRLVCESQGDDKTKGFSEVFVPEFCNKYEFPGVLWYKAVLLPCIVHRLSMLLVAYELRAEIATETNYGYPLLKQGYQWKPIEVDLAVTVKAMLSQIEDPVPAGSASIDRINDEESRPVRFLSMKETIYQLHKQKISKEYPWDERNEPTDIDRHMSTVTVMDIECYDEFLSVVVPPQGRGDVTTTPPSRASPAASTSAAILPPPPKYVDKIGVLSQKLSPQGPELRDILAALTTIKSHDTFDLERVETLGDSFLKFAASLYLFHKFPALNEGQLTTIKCRFIGNRNLYYAGEKRKIGGRMKVEQFCPRKDFLVPGFFAPKEVQDFIHTCSVRPTFLIGINVSQAEALTGVLTEDTLKLFKQRCSEEDSNVEKEPPGGAQPSMQGYVHSQAVSDKSVADCVEALVGTYLLSGGITGAVKVLEWFKIMPVKDNFSCLLTKKVPTVLSLGKTNEAEILRLLNHSRDEIETILNYKFKDPAYLLEALSHASYIRNRFTPSYERLEFLGDAILDFLITSHIFENCRALKPGEISDLRSALVNNVTFAAYVVKLGLNKYICSQLNPTLEGVVMKFIEYQERRNHEILEDVLYLVDEEDCHLAEYVEVPKMLSDVFESITGAIFLDSGGNLQTVWTVIYRIMWKEIESFARDVPIQPVRVLYENIHACPVFGKPHAPSPDKPKVMVPVYFTKNGQRETVYGCGGNKSQAKRAAAKLALRVLNS